MLNAQEDHVPAILECALCPTRRDASANRVLPYPLSCPSPSACVGSSRTSSSIRHESWPVHPDGHRFNVRAQVIQRLVKHFPKGHGSRRKAQWIFDQTLALSTT
eukprot:602727-Alexandrium_andersonii.AAC.1